MTGLLKKLKTLFQKPHNATIWDNSLLQQVLTKVNECCSNGDNCILVITPTTVEYQTTLPVASCSVISNEKVCAFKETLLLIEDRLVKEGHYCIVKLAEDKTYANMFIYIDESIFN